MIFSFQHERERLRAVTASGTKERRQQLTAVPGPRGISMQPCWPQRCPWEENVSGWLYILLSVFLSVLVIAIADLSSSLSSGSSLLPSRVDVLQRSCWRCPSAGFGLEPGEDTSTVMNKQHRANITLHLGFGKHWALDIESEPAIVWLLLNPVVRGAE